MIGKNLISLAEAISQHEGWIFDNPETPTMNEESLAFKNNNPGNLRTSPFAIGKRGGFAFFYNEVVGLMALYWDLFQKCTGNTVTGLNGQKTLEDLINVYAPPSENDTERYLCYIESKTGFKRSTKLVELLTK